MLNVKRKGIVAWILLVAMLITTVFGTVNPSVAMAAMPELTYTFANAMAGFAEGTITIQNQADGNYYLYFADEKEALKGYYEIAKVKVVDGKGSFTFKKNIAIPADATKVIAFKADKTPANLSVAKADLVYEIPEEKQNPNKSSDKTLSFEELSDTQLDYQSTVFYTLSEKHFAMALEDAAARNVDFITTSGDCINNYENGTSKEWQRFQKIIAESSYTGYIYEGNGNHSMKSDIKYGLQAFTAATGLAKDQESIGDKPYYEITAANGDHFIFVAVMTSSSVSTVDEFTEEEMDWFEGLLEKYYGDGHNIFVFEHAFFQGWGPGDNKESGIYNGGLRYTTEFPNNKRFKELFDKYKEIFLYTGHSHFDFMYDWNYDNEDGKTANLFHVPSCACTTHVTKGKMDYTMNEHDSQCFVVDVYPDMVISNGLNVVDNMIYPEYTYVVSTKDFCGAKNEKEDPGVKEPYVESTTMIDVQIVDGTSSKYLLTDNGALFLYNNDSGNYYAVDGTTMIAKIPDNAVNLTLYRCVGEWGVGSKKDAYCPGFYNVFGPYVRGENQVLFKAVSSSKANQNFWMDGEIVTTPSGEDDPSKEDPGKEDPGKEDPGKEDPVTETVTMRWAIPSALATDEISYKTYLNDVAKNSYGDYKFEKTEETFTKDEVEYNVYEYTMDAATVSAIDTNGGLSRIQIKGATTDGTKLQVVIFQYGDKTVKIADSADLMDHIAMITDVTWDTTTKMSTKTRTFGDDFVAYPYVEEVKPEVVIPEGYIKVHVTDNTSTTYIFGSGAKVFVYDPLTKEHYEIVVDESKTAGDVIMPDSVTSMIVYRCNGEWGVGGSDATKNDNGIGYWNKWETANHKAGWDQLVLGGASSSDSNWIANTEGFAEDTEFYLQGYFNGKDYTGKKYKFDENNELEMTFTKDSYVYVMTSEEKEYRTNGWLGMNLSSGTLYLTDTMSTPDKLYVPSGKIRFKLTTNEDGSIFLKYEILHVDVDKRELTLASDDIIDAEYAPVVDTLGKLLPEVEKVLTEDYRYASYESYIDLKRIYFEYVTTENKDLYEKMLEAFQNYLAMKKVNNIVTVYFCNDIPWTCVNVYAYSSKTGAQINTLETAWGMSLIHELNCGVKIYEVTLNQSIFDKIVFTNSDGKRTVELDVPVNNHTGFYFSDGDYTSDVVTPGRFIYNYDFKATLAISRQKKTLEKRKAALESYKNAKIKAVGKLRKAGDSRACLKLISQAKAAIKATKYNEKKTLSGNRAVVNGIVRKLNASLAAQRRTEYKKNSRTLSSKFKLRAGKNITVTWGRVSGAKGYEIYMAYTGKDKLTRVKTVKSGKTTKTVITKLKGKAILSKRQVKCYIIAYKLVNGKKVRLGRTAIRRS